MHMRAEMPALCGRDHLAYRSYYYPIKVLLCIYYVTIVYRD